MGLRGPLALSAKLLNMLQAARDDRLQLIVEGLASAGELILGGRCREHLINERVR